MHLIYRCFKTIFRGAMPMENRVRLDFVLKEIPRAEVPFSSEVIFSDVSGYAAESLPSTMRMSRVAASSGLDFVPGLLGVYNLLTLLGTRRI